MNITRRIILAVVILMLLSGASLYTFTIYTRADLTPNILAQLLSESPEQIANERSNETQELPTPTFLSAADFNFDSTLEINLATLFSAPVVFEQDITAPNIIYELTSGEGIELSGDPQAPTITNTGLLSLEGLNGDVELASDNISISTSGNTITLSANIPSLPELPDFPDGAIVGTTDTQLLTNKSVNELTFVPAVTPTANAGKLYFDSSDETLYVYTQTYGWRDLTAGAFVYTTDGEGIELVGNEFQLELDGTSLEKSVTGLRVSADVSLLGQSIDTLEIENGTILPEDLNSGGTAPSNGYVLIYDGGNSSFQWQSPSAVFGSNWSRDIVNGILYPSTVDDVVSIASATNTPLTLTNTSSKLSLLINDELGDTTPFAIDSNGYVGIGTTAPQYPLDVFGVIGVNNIRAVFIPNQTTFAGSFVLGDGGTNLLNGGGSQAQENTFIGLGAGFLNTTAYNNTFVGADAGYTTTTGFNNTFIGQQAGYANLRGRSNTFLGHVSGGSNSDGDNNVFVGDFAGFQNTSGDTNTAVGAGANFNNQTGSNNVILGYQAGFGSVVHNKAGNVFIGYRAGYNELGNNRLYIENSNSSSPLIWGDFQGDIVGINGALGVGTIAPAAKLDVSAATTQMRLKNGTTYFADFYVNPTGELGILPSGTNIGLGTTDPEYRLDVVGTGRFTGDLRLEGAFYDGAGNTGSAGDILTSTGVGTTWRPASSLFDSIYFKDSGNSFGADAFIGTADSYSLSIITDGVAKMYIDPTGDIGIGGILPATDPTLFVSSSGRVGIGTTSPTVDFQTLGQMMINSTTNADEELHIGASPGSTDTAISMENNGIIFEIHVTQSGLFRITNSSETNEYFAIDSSGQVGIGTTNPGSQLSIAGLGSSSGTALVIDASGNVWRDSSSRRYKTNIQKLDADFRKILDLEPVSYDFTGTGVKTIGYIAEDLDAMGLNDLVVYDQFGQPDAIKYDRLAIYLTEVVKDQQRSISDLNNWIDIQLDSEGSVAITMPETSSLPTSEFEKIDIDKEAGDEFLALKQLVNTKLVNDIEAVQNDVINLGAKVQNTSSQSADLAARTEFAIATLSGKLADVENQILGLSTQALTASVSSQITTEDAVFGNITAMGNANFYDLGITGDLIAGLIKIDAETTSINTFAEPLRLQSEKMADVEIMDGLVRITREGDLEVDGTVKAGKFMVDTSDKLKSSAGEGVMVGGESSLIIQTERVSDGSLIYVTFTSDYSPATRYWVEGRKNGESFILKTDQPMAQDSSFSWWIVN